MEDALTGLAGVLEGKSSRHCLAVVLGCCAVTAAWAQEAPTALDRAAEAALAERTEAPVRLELNAPALPSFGAPEAGQPPRIDLSLLTPGTTGIGPMVGLNNLPGTARASAMPGFAPSRSSLDLGLHLRHATPGNRQIDVTAWRRLASEQDAFTLIQQRQPAYGARVEMQLAPARSTPLLFDRGFVGLQLQGGGRISVKRKDGRPMVYYRTSF